MAATVVVFVRTTADAAHAIFRCGEESGIDDDETVVVRRDVVVAAQKARRPNMILQLYMGWCNDNDGTPST
jgi:hypothetical protein